MRLHPLILVPIASALLLAGCQQFADSSLPQTTVFPASDYGDMIQSLYSLIFWMAVVVFIGVEGFLLYTVIRFRRKRADEMPAQTHGNMRLEVAWTVLPSIVLLVISIPSIGTIFESDTIPSKVDVHIKVTGHQWWWEVEYQDLGVVTANEFHLPVGKTVSVNLASADIVHSFWVPRMGGKVDVFPNRSNHLWFTPKETGEFYGQCVEFCGMQHANMRMRLFVDTPAQFDEWVQRQRQPAPQPDGALAQRGAQVFQKTACVSCHTIRGTKAEAKIGPDLTHVGGRKTIAAGIMDNTTENLTRWVRDPQGVKVESKMIKVPLTDQDLAAVVAYIQSLK
jgi:cytochrome c oxidase subunit 2